MNVLSLFDGMSCGRIALERVGIKVDNYFASEIDKFAIQIAKKNYPDTKHIGDVTEVYGFELPEIDLLLGGSPCQGFSFAGKQLAFDDPRSVLFFEFVRLLKEVKPKYFLLENVRMKKEHQDVITEHLGVEPININSNLVSAQNRNRWYWTNIPGVGLPDDKGIMLEGVLEGAESAVYQRPRGNNVGGMRGPKSPAVSASSWQHNVLVRKKSKTIRVGGRSSPPGSRQEWDNVYQKFEDMDLKEWRKLTPIECERLQTLPDNYTAGVSNAQRYKMIGNGWTVDVIAHILKSIEQEAPEDFLL